MQLLHIIFFICYIISLSLDEKQWNQIIMMATMPGGASRSLELEDCVDAVLEVVEAPPAVRIMSTACNIVKFIDK